MKSFNLPLLTISGLLVACSLQLLFISCNTGNQSPGDLTPSAVSSDLRPLYDEILAVHDEVMPDLGTLTTLQEQVKIKLDELRALPDDKDAIVEANRILGTLNKAENAMWSWMHNFAKLDSIPQTQQEAFLKVEKLSVQDMKELVLTSIEQANSYLKIEQ
ncbi:MAG: hypothetical protein OEQ53_01790 [Saprospiraceae bacterium]|nr:hypothetical protein [Saprospiraceae bacterium]